MKPFTHTNRHGTTYYLHEGRTKTGKPRYFFAKTVREGALARVPDGFEVSESINGVVSVRRKRQGRVTIPAADVKLVEAELRRHKHLAFYVARAVDDAIVIYEPLPKPAELEVVASRLTGPFGAKAFIAERLKKARYDPVMKFERENTAEYSAYRMTYRGSGGWSYVLASGPLERLAKKLVPVIGTEKFFELV